MRQPFGSGYRLAVEKVSDYIRDPAKPSKLLQLKSLLTVISGPARKIPIFSGLGLTC